VVALDVNVVLGAYRVDLPHHGIAAGVLSEAVVADGVALPEAVLASAVRIATNPRIFNVPSTHDEIFQFIRTLRARSNVVVLCPGAGHWSIFERLCRQTDACGNLVTDAWLAALAIEHDCEWVSFDRDFARFPELRWRNPAR
jgi:toxin-antitoxin system PIN domain toxin